MWAPGALHTCRLPLQLPRPGWPRRGISAARAQLPAFSFAARLNAEARMVLRPIDDTKLGAQALAYVIELYRELTAENGAPTLGTQNQAVDFIRSNPELRRAVAAWAATVEIDEATTAQRQRLSFDALYDRVRAFLERTMAPS